LKPLVEALLLVQWGIYAPRVAQDASLRVGTIKEQSMPESLISDRSDFVHHNKLWFSCQINTNDWQISAI
jgi:hypothetical protein